MTQQRRRRAGPTAMVKPLEGIPLPDLENLPDYHSGFWEGARNRELRMQQCSDCNKFRHVPSPMCPHCHSLRYHWTRVSGRGRVYSFIIAHHPVHKALREKEQTPYNVCLIELEEQEGLRIVSNVLNIPPDEICIDMPVEVTFIPAVDDPEVVLPQFQLVKKQ